MKILIAPDSFKGSLDAIAVANHIENGILKVLPEAEVLKMPMADGGEGTVKTLVEATRGRYIYKEVTGPLGERVNAYFGVLGNEKSAVVEMTTASGLPLVPEGKETPLKATTYGTGELIKYALDEGVKDLIIGIGGSATSDAGIGMAQALGASFKYANGQEVGFGGRELNKITEINLSKLDKRIKETKIHVACDVNNPLYGPDGAAYIYAPQKGASLEQVKILDNNLRYFAELVEKELGLDLQGISGAGAAGGLGAGLVAFLNGELNSGLDIILANYNIEEILQGVDLVITGEGKIDQQSLCGKVPIGVARRAAKYHIPVVALTGIFDYQASAELNNYIDAIFCIAQEPVSIKEAISNTSVWIEVTSEQIIRLLKPLL